MLPQHLQKTLVYLFTRILSLNKTEFTSLPFTILLLITKCIVSTLTIISIFFANQTAFHFISPFISSLLILHDTSENMVSLIMCLSLIGMNILVGLLFVNFFAKKQFKIGNEVLLTILIFLQTFKYVLVILVCSQIREEISQGKIFFGIINSINFVVILFWIFVFEKFYFTLNYATNNLLARFNLQIHQYIEISLVMVTIVMTIIGPQNLTFVLQLIFNVVLLGMKIVFIYKGLLKWLYVDRIIQEINAFFVVFETVALFANLLIQLTSENLLKSNFFLSIFMTALFFFLGWKSYFDWKREDIYFVRGKDIKDVSRAESYLKGMHEIISKNKHNSQDSPLVLATIKKQHEMECKDLNCYCRSHNDALFMQEYSIQQLKELRQTFKGTPTVLIQELNFRFYIFNAYPDILNKLEHIKTNFSLSLTEQYSFLSLKTELINSIEEKNRSFHIIDIESPLRLEEMAKKIETIIKNDIEKKTKKWKYLSRGLCRIQELQQDTCLEISFLKEITEIDKLQMKNFKRSILFNILLMFYYRKISFLNMRNDEIQKNLSDQFKKIKEEELSATKQFAKWIFHKRSCVFESLIDAQNMGVITKSSKNVHQMFGYNQSKIIGMNMNKLMPNFMADEHDAILKNWLKTGTWRTVGKLKEVFCVHKDQMCFSALIYIKVMANENGLFFVGVVFKKNESDYMILNQKKQIEGIGRKFVHLIGQNCRKIPIQLLCSDFPGLDLSKQDEFKYFVREFISLSGQNGLTEIFLEQKNRKFLTQAQEELFIKNYQSKIAEKRQVEKWEVRFGLRIYRMRDVSFYVILLNYAKKIQTLDGLTISRINQDKIQLIVGTGKVNENEDIDAQSEAAPSNATMNEGRQQFFEQKNSSMVSAAERQSFTLSKLLKVFYDFMIHPSDIRNRRISTLNISTLLETIILTTLISVSFFIYMSSLNEIKSYVQASTEINQRMQLAISMYNKVVSFQEYRDDTETMTMFLDMTSSDLKQFYTTLAEHLQSINTATSQLHSQQLYQYLKSPIKYFSDQKNTIEIEVLQFLTYYYYLASDIKNIVVKDRNTNILQAKAYQISRIQQNFPQLKEISASISRMFGEMTQATKSRLIVIAWSEMTVFLVITFLFFMFSYNYFSFRFQQKMDCLQIYRAIPPNLIDKIKQYYGGFYYALFQVKGNKVTGIMDNFDALSQMDLTIEDKPNSSMPNKIKFIGRQKFSGWIRSFLMFLAINTVNILFTYEIDRFVSPLGSFMSSVTNIIDTENKQLSSYLDIKGIYLLSRNSTLNVTLVDNVLADMNTSEVRFNEMVMFESETLTLYDPDFYTDFHNLLVENVCLEIKDIISEDQFKECMGLSNKGLIEDGIITYMNFFQRKVRTVLEDLRVNSTLRLSEQKGAYFFNRGFREVDLCISYSIKLFRKLIQRIIFGYKKGIEYINLINIVVLFILITPQIMSLVLWFHLINKEKIKLSLLYGSVLMIPPNVIRHVKNLPRMAKKILEFEEY